MSDSKSIDHVPYESRKTIYNQTIVIAFPTPYLQQTFDLRCPFVPDIIQVRAMEQENLANNDILEVVSSLFGNEPLCVYALNNSFNPVYEWDNINRRSIQGRYTVDVRTPADGVGAEDATLILHFKFVRYNVF